MEFVLGSGNRYRWFFLSYLTAIDNYEINIWEETKMELNELGISDFSGMVPQQVFNWTNVTSNVGLIFILTGGFLIGFGTRYANGCTFGHTIMGLSNFRLSSLIATIGFFIGGLIMTHFLLPYILYSEESPPYNKFKSY